MSILDQKPLNNQPKTHIDVGQDGATVDGAVFETATPAAKDWAQVFERFNLDPEEFEIVDDTVRFSSWDQSKRTENGDRDVVKLFSFKARFKRRARNMMADHTFDELRAELRAHKPTVRKPHKELKKSKNPNFNLADWQWGKEHEGGIEAMKAKAEERLDNAEFYLSQLRKRWHIKELSIVNMGDITEGCDGWYPNQLHSVLLNNRQQWNLALDTLLTWSKHLFPQAEMGHMTTVLSNHGEQGRTNGNKNMTDDSDNKDGQLAEALQLILAESPRYEHVKFHIPDNEMITYVTVDEVPVAYTHGHKIKGSDSAGFTRWVEGQQRSSREAWEAAIWNVAHRHNFQSWDIGSAFCFQCPTMDGGSKSFKDETGKYSRPGVLAYAIDKHETWKWSDQKFL